MNFTNTYTLALQCKNEQSRRHLWETHTDITRCMNCEAVMLPVIPVTAVEAVTVGATNTVVAWDDDDDEYNGTPI